MARPIFFLLALLFIAAICLQATAKPKGKHAKSSSAKPERKEKEIKHENKQAKARENVNRWNVKEAQPNKFKHAAVAADHYNCSIIGKDILKRGGNAVDSIIAVHHCVEVCNLHSTGLGGGGFMNVYMKGKTPKDDIKAIIDFRETLPLGFNDEKNKTQGETILVPGVLKGLWEAHQRFGRLPWKDLFQPAIKLARYGFRIHPALAKAIEKKNDFIDSNLGLRELFKPNGFLLREGDVLRRPKLANTYERLAEQGADLFYKGAIAQQIVKDIREAGGTLSLKDLAEYKAIVRRPLEAEIKGLTMLSNPPPGSGALISLALKIMEGFNWNAEDMNTNERAPLTYHRIVEALKFAYAPFTFLTDPGFNNNTEKVVKYMMSPEVAENMRKRIDDKSHTVDYYGPYSEIKYEDTNGTSHMSVVGTDGDAASMTTSINAYFGSKLVSRELGFIYNNELADFSEFWPSIYNLTRDEKNPGKRPMSKSSPTIFIDKDRNVQAVFGAAGGFFIPSCLSMTMANWLFFGDNLKVAVSRPRLHCQLFPPTIVYEPTFPDELVPKLKAFHHVSVTNSTYDVSGQMHAIMGVVQAIVRDSDGKLAAVSDYRKGGKPAGF
ncbi:glutathione hydrolase 1 proenzyme-like [Rhopilema esculentum]|uniref:glutathione hydrolase 1 proenzyme-like n=1 Tax=Rhopilema esculentum TaxID=499914 RepID=UPI0031D359C6